MSYDACDSATLSQGQKNILPHNFSYFVQSIYRQCSLISDKWWKRERLPIKGKQNINNKYRKLLFMT